MKGNAKIIEGLNRLLAGELTAMDVYFLHSRMFQNQGIMKLYQQFAHEQQDETEHAAALIERILFLEGRPDLVARHAFDVGINVKDILEKDLALEYEVARNLKEVMTLCENEKDYVTREILSKLLVDTEEDHILWLETQLKRIEQIGIENYIQSMS